jgi:hypothetical protein
MHLITVCNKRTPGLDLWEKTAKLNSFQPVILGLKDSRELGHETQHFGLKFLLLAKYLQTLPPQDTCLITDGFDVIFYNALDLEGKLQALPNHQLLFAADVYENPDQGLPYKTQFYRAPYLNSGVYAGKAAAILHVIQNVLDMDEDSALKLDDQRYFTEYMFNHPGELLIDHGCYFFACTAGLEYKKDFYMKEGNLIVLGNLPRVLHFQGFFKDTRIVDEMYSDPEIKQLGKKLLRMPSKWGKFIGDTFVKLGGSLGVDKQYRVHAGACLSILLLISLLVALKPALV